MNSIIFHLVGYSSLIIVIFILRLLYKSTQEELTKTLTSLKSLEEELKYDRETIESLKKKLKNSSMSSTDSRLDFMRNENGL